jgi:acetyl esterase/lipase
MNAWRLLDPQLAPLFEGAPNPVFATETLPALRQAMGGAPIVDPRLDESGILVEQYELPRGDGTALRLIVLRPREGDHGALPGVLHGHPGGWILGAPETSAATLIHIACGLPCVVVSVDYRLAPEHPFPAAHDDMMLALQWMRAEAQQLCVDPMRIILAGESAGANVAAGLALRCRDEGRDQGIVAISLVYAALDDRQLARPPHPYAGTIGLGREQMRFAWESYIPGAPSPDVSAYAAPMRAEHLRDLPPVFLAVGALDPFIEDNLSFAQRLIHDGVSTTLHVFAGAPHGFDRLDSADVTQQLRSLRRAHLQRHLTL